MKIFYIIVKFIFDTVLFVSMAVWNAIAFLLDCLEFDDSDDEHSQLGNHYNHLTGDVDAVKMPDGSYSDDINKTDNS